MYTVAQEAKQIGNGITMIPKYALHKITKQLTLALRALKVWLFRAGGSKMGKYAVCFRII